MSDLKIVYAGTPEFARTGLQAILDAGFSVSMVLTQPDRPAGRGMQLRLSPVKELALQRDIPILQPTGLRLDGRYSAEATHVQQVLMDLKPDVMIVAAYGLILPQWVLDLPRYGCLNIHASLLPRWRGAAPIHRAIEAGDQESGICIMQMDAGLDTGDVISRCSLPIAADETTGTLHDKLAALGGGMIVEVLPELAAGRLIVAAPQPEDGISYAHKIDKSESLIDWNRPAVEIERKIRAFDPFPGVFTHYGDVRLKIWRAQVQSATSHDTTSSNGEVVAVTHEGIVVRAGLGFLKVSELQRPGGKRQFVKDFLQAVPIKAGDYLH